MACAVAPNWPSFLIFRLLCGISASSPIAVVGGLYADIYNDPIARGRALAFFMGVGFPSGQDIDPKLKLIGVHVRSGAFAHHLRLSLNGFLEMELLCRAYNRRRLPGFLALYARDLRAIHIEKKSAEIAA